MTDKQTGTVLRRGARYVYTERNDRSRGPFIITKIDGTAVTVCRKPTNTVDVIEMGDDPYAIVEVRNSVQMFWRRGDILAQATEGSGHWPWILRVGGADLSDAAAAGAKDIAQGQARFHNGFDELAKYAKQRFGVTTWARDRFGGWVPAADWRAVTPGLPCHDRGCDRAVFEDGLCKMHAGAKQRRIANDAIRAEEHEVIRGEMRRKAAHRKLCEDALERIQPALTELGIHPQTVIVGTTDGRVGILLPAEAAEQLVELAVEGHMLARDYDAG